MSLFGAQTQPSTNIFGNTNTQQQPGQTTSGGMFSNPSSQPSTSGTSPFGTTSTATNTAAGTSGGLFGNAGAQQQQQPTSGLFGNTTAAQQPATGGLFGSTSTQTQPTGTNLFGTAAQPAGGMFGNAGAQQQQQPQTSTHPSTSIFGNTSTTTGTPAGSMFGNASAQQQQQQQPTSSGLFGTTTTTQQPATGGLLGSTNTQTQPAGTNLFGNTGTQQQQQPQSNFGSNAAQQPATGGLFGTSTTQPSMFGTSTQAPASGGLFGSTAAQAPATGGGLFGGTNTTSNPLFGNKNPASIFGTAPTTSSTTPNLFGQPAQGSVAPSLFGQSQQAPAGSLFASTNQPVQSAGGLFGSTLGAPASNSLLASRSAPGQQQDPQSQYAVLEQKIQAIVQAWNPASPECRFQHYFYNLVPPEQVSAFGRPANATNEALWQRAVRDNPDPSCMVPVLAIGFDDLRQRVDGQSKQAAEQQKGLMELKKRLESLSAKHNDNNASRLQRAKSLQSQIQHRLLCLIQHMHLMLPTVRSTAIRPEEDALRVALEEIEEDIKRPGGVGKMRGKLNELWALVGAINAARERGRKAGLDGTSDWTVVDEEGLKQIAQILSNQQAGLQHLTKVLQRDLRDLEVIYGKES